MEATTNKENSISQHNITWLPIKDIVVKAGRARKTFTSITDLANNIKRHGLLHPIVINAEDNTLLAGERRYRACSTIPLIWNTEDERRTPANHSVRKILAGFIPTTNREALSDDQKHEIELDENVQRVNLEWAEQIELRDKIHTLKIKIYGQKSESNPDGWSMDQTAAMFGESAGGASAKITFAREIKEHAAKVDPKIIGKLSALPLSAAIKEFDRVKTTAKVQRLSDQGSLVINEDLKEGDAVELTSSLPPDSIDLVLTDPPFGNQVIEEQAGVGTGVGSSVSYTTALEPEDNLDKESVLALMKMMAPQWFRVLKPSSHIWVFYTSELYEPLYNILSGAGFEISRVPVIWYKGRSTAPFRGYEPAPSYEPILFGHKPPRTKRLSDSVNSVFTFPPIHASKKVHRFEKPVELLNSIIKLSTNIGDTVLDSFAGSGSTLRAAKALGRSCIGFEKNHKNYLRAMAAIQGIS